MRKLATFIVIVSAVMALMDHLPATPSSAPLPVKTQSAVSQADQKPKPEIQSAHFTPEPPKPTYSVGGGCEQYRSLINKYDWDRRVMMAVMEAESSCVSDKVGDTWPINGVLAPSCGLLQVRTIAAWRGSCDQLKDPEFNLDIAYRVWQGQGYGAWSVYSSGKYLRFIR